jgi:hypothetical protein
VLPSSTGQLSAPCTSRWPHSLASSDSRVTLVAPPPPGEVTCCLPVLSAWSSSTFDSYKYSACLPWLCNVRDPTLNEGQGYPTQPHLPASNHA